MTDRELMQQALEALTCSGEHDDPGHRCAHCDDYVDRNGPVRAALRKRLEQLEQTVSMDEYKRLQDLVTSQGIRLMEYESELEPDAPHWNSYKQGWEDGVVQERQRIVNLLMIQHEMAKGAHNYWHVAAQLIQADVASDT